MESNIKTEIIEMVNSCEDELLLQGVKDYLSNLKSLTDFSGLNEMDREELMQQIEEPIGYDSISFEEFKRNMEKWNPIK